MINDHFFVLSSRGVNTFESWKDALRILLLKPSIFLCWLFT